MYTNIILALIFLTKNVYRPLYFRTTNVSGYFFYKFFDINIFEQLFFLMNISFWLTFFHTIHIWSNISFRFRLTLFVGQKRSGLKQIFWTWFFLDLNSFLQNFFLPNLPKWKNHRTKIKFSSQMGKLSIEIIKDPQF